MDRATVEDWVDRYEALWRTPGTDGLADLFLPDATYLPSPWAQTLAGRERDAVARPLAAPPGPRRPVHELRGVAVRARPARRPLTPHRRS